LNTDTNLENKNNRIRLIVAIIVSVYFTYYCFSYNEWHFIDNINLIIHEAGHSVFAFFGEFINILGGTIFQIGFPLLFVYYFYKNKDFFSSSLLLFWVGQNIVNVSAYVSDAQVMQLPLLGGDGVGHDWNNLLQMTGLLKYTDIIGSSIYALGVIVIICAICFSLITSLSEKDISFSQIFKKIYE
jgi:hypothetical protein